MANLAQLVNAIAPIFTNRQGLFLQTIYHPLRLYAEHTSTHALDVHVDGPVYDLRPDQEDERRGRVHHVADLGPFALLDATATSDDAGKTLTLAVVNRDKDRHYTATIDLGAAGATGDVEVAEVTGPSVESKNSFEHPDTVGVRERRVEVKGSRFDYEFPARSLSVLRMRLG